MNYFPSFRPGQIAPLLFLGFLAACGSENDGAVTPTSSDVAIRFSDAPVDALSKVLITVDRITFSQDGEEDISVDQFTSSELGITNADTFTIDLLEVQGDENRLVLDSIELPVGHYSDLRLDILDEDLNFSYVEESSGGELKNVKVPSGELKLGAFDVSPLSTQTFVIEFGLRQSMTYNPGPDRYILKPRGVRIVQLEQAAAIEGTLDVNALHLQSCMDKEDVTVGNVIYLYTGLGLDSEAMADDFDPDSAGADADNRIAPIASAIPDSDSRFIFSYLEPGDYTLAVSCDAANDDADALDTAITVPSSDTQVIETSVAAGQRKTCSLGAETISCSPLETGTNI